MSAQKPDSERNIASSRPLPDAGAQIGFSLFEVIAALWQRKWTVVGVSVVFAVSSIVYALLVTPIYESEAVLVTSDQDTGANVPSSLGGLAGFAGIALGSSTGNEEKLATLRSRIFVEEFIVENDLLKILFADQWDPTKDRWASDDPETWPNVRDGVDLFIENVRFVDAVRETGVIVLSIRWTDPQLTVEWAEGLVSRINERLRNRDLAESKNRLKYLNSQLAEANLVEMRQAISRLIENEIQTIMLAQADSEYAFKVIDPPRMPNERVYPNRKLIVILATMVGSIFGVIVALGSWALARMPRD